MHKLLVFKLSIQSSYAKNEECEAEDDCFDTLQWWFSGNETWRIKTFAIDLDIHTHRIEEAITEEFAIENTKNNYGDVIAAAFIVELIDLNDPVEVADAMEEFGGLSALEMSKTGAPFGFWNPLQLNYSSKTRPI